MKVLYHLLIVDIKRALYSKGFAVSVFSIAVLYFFSAGNLVYNCDNSLEVYNWAISSTFSVFPFLLCSFPYATSFVTDQNNNYTYMISTKTGISNYAASKSIVTCVSGFLALFAGECLFVFLTALFIPLTNLDPDFLAQASTQFAYGTLLSCHNDISFFLLTIINRSLIGGILSLLALLISVKIPNVFVVAFSPIVIYYLLINGIQKFLPKLLKISYLYSAKVRIIDNYVLNFLYIVGLTLFLNFLISVITVGLIKRRTQNV